MAPLLCPLAAAMSARRLDRVAEKFVTPLSFAMAPACDANCNRTPVAAEYLPHVARREVARTTLALTRSKSRSLVLKHLPNLGQEPPLPVRGANHLKTAVRLPLQAVQAAEFL